MSLFRQEAIDHKRRKLHGEVILIQPLSFYFYTAAFLFLTGVAAYFMVSRDYIRKETALGYISASSGTTIIRADRGGRVAQLFVSEGQIIEAGAPLFESRVDIDTVDGFVSARQLQSTEARLAELNNQIDATRSRYRAEGQRLDDQITSYVAELEGLDRRYTLQQQAVDFSRKRLAKLERLLIDDTVSQVEVDQARSEDINQALALENIIQQRIVRTATLKETRYARGALGPAQEQELSQLRQQIAQLQESRAALQASSAYLVRSPVAGRVTAVQGYIGQTLNANMPVVAIVPTDAELIATLLLPTQSAGFVAVGQDVNLLVDAFPYQKFGVQTGQIAAISETPFRPGELEAPISFDQPVYRVRVALDQETITAYGEDVAFKPGMTLQGDVVTDRRSLIEWMLDPLFTLRRS